MSNEYSTVQQVHFDYEGDWKKFDRLQLATGV